MANFKFVVGFSESQNVHDNNELWEHSDSGTQRRPLYCSPLFILRGLKYICIYRIKLKGNSVSTLRSFAMSLRSVSFVSQPKKYSGGLPLHFISPTNYNTKFELFLGTSKHPPIHCNNGHSNVPRGRLHYRQQGHQRILRGRHF